MKWMLGISLAVGVLLIWRRLEKQNRDCREGLTFLTEQFAEHGHLIRDGLGEEVLACTDVPSNLVDMLQEMEMEAVENNLVTKH